MSTTFLSQPFLLHIHLDTAQPTLIGLEDLVDPEDLVYASNTHVDVPGDIAVDSLKSRPCTCHEQG